MILVYWVIGACGFIYWFTKDCDITIREVPIILIIGWTGPISFVIGWSIHSGSSGDKILIKKRRHGL